MWRVSGRLRELNHRGPFLEEVWTIYLLEENSLHATTKLQIYKWSLMSSLKVHLILFRVYQIQWTQKSNHALGAHSQQDKNNGKFKRVAAVAYER